ncbi:MAG TPA: hypothetical protein PK323_00445 [Bacteroidia bacterium]|nr:hypothetical protein [Bacteroidia bacterium]
MKKNSISTVLGFIVFLTMNSIVFNSKAQTANNSSAAVATPVPAQPSNVQTAKPMSEEERKAQGEKMKADREMNMKMGQLNKEIQEAEKAGKADSPEIVAKKAELKKLQDERREKMMKERAANPPAGQQEMIKINQLNKEIQEAEKAGKADAPETVAKKAEVKKLQEERNKKLMAEREKMMKERPMPTPEEIEANKKMGQLNKEIKDAEKEGKGDTPEIIAKKAELKKMQDARIEKMKADREKKMKEQQQVQSKPSEAKPSTVETPKK